MRRTTLALALGLVSLLGTAAPALADATQHSQHLALAPTDDAPLRSGFVENIHAEGPIVYALERYVLVGAVPGATFQVTLEAHPLDPDCSDPVGALIPTATFTTNAAGNGHGAGRFAPEDVADFPTGTHGVDWVVTDGTHEYRTGCTAVTLD